MADQFTRTARLLGEDAIHTLARSRVAVFGLGGVGSFAAEALARAGVGALDLVDDDTVCESNLNRQLIALHSTLGKGKAAVMAARIRDINPRCMVFPHACFFDATTKQNFDFTRFDYVIDAIDTVTSKLLLAEICHDEEVRLISCMGTGNKLDPTQFELADIYATSICPLARIMRQELRRRGIPALKVLYSKEPPLTPIGSGDPDRPGSSRRQTPGSVSFVPSAAGLILAGEVIKELTSNV